MRTVRDQRGVTWICLELPEVPIDQRAAAQGQSADVVAIECDAGADRVIALVAPGWQSCPTAAHRSGSHPNQGRPRR